MFNYHMVNFGTRSSIRTKNMISFIFGRKTHVKRIN